MTLLGLNRLEVTDQFTLIHLKSPAKIAECLMLNVKFAKDDWGNIYYYENGVYKIDSSLWIIGQLYQMILKQYNRIERWYSRGTADIAKYLVTRIPKVLDRPCIDRINLLNGIYYLDNGIVSGRFESHTEYDHSSYITTVQVPIEYNPVAECPCWDEFNKDVFPEDPNLLVQVVGLCMVPFTGLQKCIVLLGAGANGKGTFINAIQHAVGDGNFANLDLERITGSRSHFNNAGLVGKLVNVFGDIPPNKMENKAIFKALTGQDTITVEYKGKQSFSYKPFARLIFACNAIMESDDHSVGYKRRFFCIPFDTVFNIDSEKGKELEENLSSPNELSGLLNRILPQLPYIMNEGLIYNDAAAEKVKNYTPVPTYFKEWAEQYVMVDPGLACTARSVFNAYTLSGYPPEGSNRDNSFMFRMLKALYPDIRTTQGLAGLPVSQRMQTCYVGLAVIRSNEKIDDVHWYYNEENKIITPNQIRRQ